MKVKIGNDEFTVRRVVVSHGGVLLVTYDGREQYLNPDEVLDDIECEDEDVKA